MSHDLSRKHFVAKGLGLLALAGLAPKLRVFSASGSAAKADALAAADGRVSALRAGSAAQRRAASAHSQTVPQVRVEPRAIARSDFAMTAPTTSTAAAAVSFRN